MSFSFSVLMGKKNLFDDKTKRKKKVSKEQNEQHEEIWKFIKKTVEMWKCTDAKNKKKRKNEENVMNHETLPSMPYKKKQ